MLREVVVVQVVEDLAEAVEAAVDSAAAVVVEDSTEEVVASEEEEEDDSHWLLVIRLYLCAFRVKDLVLMSIVKVDLRETG